MGTFLSRQATQITQIGVSITWDKGHEAGFHKQDCIYTLRGTSVVRKSTAVGTKTEGQTN